MCTVGLALQVSPRGSLVVAVFVVPLFARVPQGADISVRLPSLAEVLHRSYTEKQLPRQM